MESMRRDAGITAIAILIILVLIGFAIFIVFRAAPVYIEAYNVSNALQGLQKDLEIRSKSVPEIREQLKRAFEVNDVSSVDLKNDVEITKNGQQISVMIDYEVVKPLFGNVSLLFDFNKSLQIN
jgi:hypothetical protein